MALVGIVGGGIAGLYCSWKLSEAGHSVTLCESLDRLGGRIETHDLHGFKAECGPMRFELSIEPHLSKLAKDLGITFDSFPRTNSGSPDFPKYDLKPEEMSAAHQQAVEEAKQKGLDSRTASIMQSHLTPALDLLQFGIYRIMRHDPAELRFTLQQVVSGEKASKISQYAATLDNAAYDRIRTKHDLDGARLYTLGFWNALSRVLSPGAIAKIRETGTFYHLLPENPSASEWSIFWLRLFRPDADLSTITAGVGSLINRLEVKIRNKANVLRKTTIEQIYEDPHTGKVRLTTASAQLPQQFDHVILAVPAVPLRNLTNSFPREIRSYVKSVIPFPLLKVFVVINNPWWSTPPLLQQGAHIVPTREVHYFWPDDKSTDRVMIMFYTDRPATGFWHPYANVPHEGAQIGNSRDLEHELALQVAQLLPKENNSDEAHLKRVEESIVCFAIRDWSEPPFGAACHAWAPRVDVPEALHQLKAFSLWGASGSKNVHVCGEAYSDYQGFIEGALRTAETVLPTIK
jgi:hypothetical protein